MKDLLASGNHIEFNQILGLFVAALAGFMIGLEREWRGKSAGLTTNTLVALGAAIFVTLSFNVTEEQGDVTRIIAQVVSGIGFLGAGIIFKEGLNIHGLTTAATLWCSAAIGAVSASGYYSLAITSLLFVLVINVGVSRLDRFLKRKNRTKDSNE